MLSPRTEKDYREVVARWTRDGQPDPRSGSASALGGDAEEGRAAPIWQFRVSLGRTLDIPWVRPLQRPVPSAFSVAELAVIREACAITLEDVTDSHVVLRDTKGRPGGLQVHRAVPLGPVSRAAVIELRQLPPGKRNTLVVACQHRVQDWMREL